MIRRNVCIFVLMGLVGGTFCLADKPATMPATQSAGATAALARIRSLMGRPRASSQAEYRKKLGENRRQALKALAEMEKKHPKADQLHEARLHGVMAAVQLGRLTNDPEMGEKVRRLAGKIIASDAPVQLKLNADAYTVLLKLRPIHNPTTRPNPIKNGERVIVDFVGRYAETDVTVDALMLGRNLAEMSDMDSLVVALEDIVIKAYPKHPAAEQIRQRREKSKVGKPFEAVLTKLDGTKLTLPDDLLGKVVVIDFWAIWCKPCVVEIPNMKSLYARYKPRGVEFVGISLDNDKRRLKAFVTNKQIGWIHTYSGKAWSDPTARKYGVRGIPSIWVVGRDGKVVSDNARGRLASTVEKALADSTTKPTGG